MRHIARGGAYVRVADPGWAQPLDGSYSARFGGRWNAPGTFPVCYLNRDRLTARANGRHLLQKRLNGLPFSVDDLDPSELPVLVGTQVADDEFVDIVSDEGCREAGLPETYPHDTVGEIVSWDMCRPIGATAWSQGEAGIGCRSAADGAPPDGEALAWFQRAGVLVVESRERFEDWYGPIDW